MVKNRQVKRRTPLDAARYPTTSSGTRWISDCSAASLISGWPKTVIPTWAARPVPTAAYRNG